MGDISKALGEPVPFQFRDTTYQLSPLTFALQAKFEFWLEGRAFEALERQRENMPAEEYEKRYAALLGDVVGGVYSFGGDVSIKAAKSLPGLKELLYISLSARHPKATRAFVDEIFEDKMKEAAAAVNAVNQDATDPQKPPVVPTPAA